MDTGDMDEIFYDMPGSEVSKSKVGHAAALLGTSVAGGVVANQLPQNSKGQKQWKQGLQNKKRAYHLKKADKWTKRWHDLDEDTSMPYKKFERKQNRAYDKLDRHRIKLNRMGYDEYGRVRKAFLKPMAPMKPQAVLKPKPLKIAKPKAALKPKRPVS